MSELEEIERRLAKYSFDEASERWEDLRECISFLRARFDERILFSDRKEMDAAYVSDFSSRLACLFNKFMIVRPILGEDYSDFVNKMRPILDEYKALDAEFKNNFV